ncbi:MAG: type II toxin-antitoxin system HicA family toxin [Acidobacteria bacterium]|nr:type II toxin-antitoxin system HicA family toxin [Acidobacteriota bacterium]
MPKLRRLSGGDVLKILALFGFEKVSQRGSHIKLQRVLTGGSKQTLTVPNHTELDAGTLKAIYRQASAFISEADLFDQFYHS